MMPTWMQIGLTPSAAVWRGPVSFTAATTVSTTAGQLTGYSVPGWYNANTPIGSIQTDLFVDRRIPANPKTIRLVGIVNQTNNFVVIGWKLEPSILPTPAMPSMQGSLKINGYTFSLSSGTKPQLQSAAYDGLYWTINGGAGIVSGQKINFEFS